eukprot:g30955.t2
MLREVFRSTKTLANELFVDWSMEDHPEQLACYKEAISAEIGSWSQHCLFFTQCAASVQGSNDIYKAVGCGSRKQDRERAALLAVSMTMPEEKPEPAPEPPTSATEEAPAAEGDLDSALTAVKKALEAGMAPPEPLPAEPPAKRLMLAKAKPLPQPKRRPLFMGAPLAHMGMAGPAKQLCDNILARMNDQPVPEPLVPPPPPLITWSVASPRKRPWTLDASGVLPEWLTLPQLPDAFGPMLRAAVGACGFDPGGKVQDVTVEVDQINFSQNSCGSRFSDGRQFEELMYMLHKGHGGITATLAGLGFVDPFVVAWREPDDDGGAPVEAFQVQCQSEEEPSLADGFCGCSFFSVLLPPETRSHGFEGFQPGSGPYKVEVRAVNRAKLWSDASEVEVITAFLPPPAPVQLAARLLPGWASRTLSPLHFEGTTGLLDFDVVKLEFISPIEDAAHPIQSYIIHAEEELSEASLEKPGPKQSSLEVAASAVTADEITRRMILLLTSKPFSFLNIHWLSRGVHVVRGSAVGSVPRDVERERPKPLPEGEVGEFPAGHWGSSEACYGGPAQSKLHTDAKKVEALFLKYASPEDHTIRPEGIEELCKDLSISALDPWHEATLL